MKRWMKFRRLGIAVITSVSILGTTMPVVAEDLGERLQNLTLAATDDKYDLGEVNDAGERIEEIPLQEEADSTSLIDIRKVAKDTMPAIVAITNVGVEKISYFGRQYDMDSESSGSGIIVGKNDTELLIATNNHVVDNATELTVCFNVDAEKEKDTLVSAQLKGSDASLDLAVIAVKLEDISEDVAGKIGIIQMGDSEELEVGEWVVAIGNALGYGQSVTFGIVSALNREISVSSGGRKITNSMIQTDAAINFGNSGGALLDTQGRLIGINSAKAAETGVEGMGYAIPIDTAKPIIEELMTQTTRTLVDADKVGFLGITSVDVSEEARELYNVPNGAYVYELTDGAAAEEAGIRKGDIITKLDQTSIGSQAELTARVKYYEAGETITVTLQRPGDAGYEEVVLDVVLSKRSDFIKDEPVKEESNSNQKQDGQDYYGYNRGFGGDMFDLFDMFGFGF